MTKIMTQSFGYLRETPSQTAGPYVHIGLAPKTVGIAAFAQDLGTDITGPDPKGERIRVTGMVIDGMGAPAADVLIETWQANADGIYANPEFPGAVEPGFRGWGRVTADFGTGIWHLDTVKPGPVPARAALGANEVDGGPPPGLTAPPVAAPHIDLWLVARGINVGLQTRMYFSDEGDHNAADPVLGMFPAEHRRSSLIAQRQDGTTDEGRALYHFNIKLQGLDETVFFDI